MSTRQLWRPRLTSTTCLGPWPSNRPWSLSNRRMRGGSGRRPVAASLGFLRSRRWTATAMLRIGRSRMAAAGNGGKRDPHKTHGTLRYRAPLRIRRHGLHFPTAPSRGGFKRRRTRPASVWRGAGRDLG